MNKDKNTLEELDEILQSVIEYTKQTLSEARNPGIKWGNGDMIIYPPKKATQSLQHLISEARLDELKLLRSTLPVNLEQLVYEMRAFEEYIGERTQDLKEDN